MIRSSIGFIIAYFVLFCMWWMLGAIIAPEQMSAFATSVVAVFIVIGKIRSNIKDLESNIRNALDIEIFGLLDVLTSKISKDATQNILSEKESATVHAVMHLPTFEQRVMMLSKFIKEEIEELYCKEWGPLDCEKTKKKIQLHTGALLEVINDSLVNFNGIDKKTLWNKFFNTVFNPREEIDKSFFEILSRLLGVVQLKLRKTQEKEMCNLLKDILENCEEDIKNDVFDQLLKNNPGTENDRELFKKKRELFEKKLCRTLARRFVEHREKINEFVYPFISRLETLHIFSVGYLYANKDPARNDQAQNDGANEDPVKKVFRTLAGKAKALNQQYKDEWTRFKKSFNKSNILFYFIRQLELEESDFHRQLLLVQIALFRILSLFTERYNIFLNSNHTPNDEEKDASPDGFEGKHADDAVSATLNLLYTFINFKDTSSCRKDLKTILKKLLGLMGRPNEAPKKSQSSYLRDTTEKQEKLFVEVKNKFVEVKDTFNDFRETAENKSEENTGDSRSIDDESKEKEKKIFAILKKTENLLCPTCSGKTDGGGLEREAGRIYPNGSQVIVTYSDPCTLVLFILSYCGSNFPFVVEHWPVIKHLPKMLENNLEHILHGAMHMAFAFDRFCTGNRSSGISYQKMKHFKREVKQIISSAVKMRKQIRIKSMTTKHISKTKSAQLKLYQTCFLAADETEDNSISFEEFFNMPLVRKELQLSWRKAKYFFAKSDEEQTGVLSEKEFYRAMKLLEDELAENALYKVGLTFENIAGIVLVGMFLFICMLIFIISGYTAFASGTAFGAGIGSLLPLAATQVANLKLDSECDGMKQKIDIWVKEAFDQLRNQDEEINK
jgi:hypothetical protein